jgi:signal transduction histidine kinase
MTLHADTRRRWQFPYGIVALWSAYVLIFLGGVSLLAHQYAAVRRAAAYVHESILWDVSQVQRELLRLGLLLERTQALRDSSSPKTLADQLDLAWSNLDRLEHGISHAWIRPQSTLAAAVAQLRGIFEHLDRLSQQWLEEPATYASQALPHVTAAHTLANHIMSGVYQQHGVHTTLLSQALHSFQRHLIGYAIGLTLLMLLLMYMTWRHLHSERARREVEHRYREVLQQARDALERRVKERTAELMAANASLQCESAERQRMAREMLAISDREQRRIGQDLHDGLGQLLAGMAFLSQALAQKLAKQNIPENTEAMQLVHLANKAMTWARELVHGLSPVELEGEGFIVALQDLAMQAEHLFGLTCQVTCDRLPPMPDHIVATHLYRIAQEAVSNAVKHGQAQHVVLGLTAGQDSTRLTIHDDGIGFQKGASKLTGMGIRSMHYRASMIGASLAIHSHVGSGTTVVCEWPHPEITEDDEGMQQWSDGATTALASTTPTSTGNS